MVDNEVVKNTRFTTRKTKVNDLEKKIPDATTLTHINQYNTDKQYLRKQNWRCWEKKYQMQLVLWLQLFWKQKSVKLRIKFLIMLNILLLKNLIG